MASWKCQAINALHLSCNAQKEPDIMASLKVIKLIRASHCSSVAVIEFEP